MKTHVDAKANRLSMLWPRITSIAITSRPAASPRNLPLAGWNFPLGGKEGRVMVKGVGSADPAPLATEEG